MHHNNNYGRQSLSPAISQNITMQYSTFFPSWAAIVGLRNCVRPSAVIRCVIPIIFDAFQRKPRWTWPHIGVKVFKTALPLKAHSNPARTVVLERLTFFVAAAFKHSLPNFVFTQMTGLVFRIHRGHNFALKAAARLCGSVKHVMHNRFRFFSAIAQKIGFRMPANALTDKHQKPIPASCRINFAPPFVRGNDAFNPSHTRINSGVYWAVSMGG